MVAPARDVLVVDDAPELLTLMELLLSAEGYVVRTASTLDQVERELSRSRPDLVVTDVRLPGLPPFAVLDRLDVKPATRGLPVLLCTGAVLDLETGGERLRRPQTMAVLKPFDIDVLLQCVERLLGNSAPLPEQASRPADLR